MENLGIDIKLLIAQVVNFAVFFWVFKRFIAKPFTKMINAEKHKEHERDRILAELTSKEERMKAEEEKFRLNLAEEKDKMIDETKKTAQALKQEILTDAKTEAKDLLDKARQQIELERASLENQIRLKAIDLSIFMIDKALKDYLTDDTKKGLTQYIVKHLGKNIKAYEN